MKKKKSFNKKNLLNINLKILKLRENWKNNLVKFKLKYRSK